MPFITEIMVVFGPTKGAVLDIDDGEYGFCSVDRKFHFFILIDPVGIGGKTNSLGAKGISAIIFSQVQLVQRLWKK